MRKHLMTKILLGFVVLALLICGACTGVGYIQYRTYIQRQYNETAYQVAAAFRDYMSKEELYDYIDMAKGYKEGTLPLEELTAAAGEPRYQELKSQLELLRANMAANDIFFVYLDAQELYDFDGNTEEWYPLTYIFDGYVDPELTFSFGDMGGLNPAFVEDVIMMVETGQRSSNYFVSKSAFGYNTSAILPILRDGKTIAVVGVEIPMATLHKALSDYVQHSIIAMMAVTAICLFLYLNYLYRTMVSPINLIAKEASKFVEEENKISDKLSQVRTGDEIQTLSETLYKMELDINQYIDNLTRVTAEKERIGAELNVATQIQADMLPRIFPAFPGRSEFDIYASMDPAKEVGGDFYDFFLVDDDHLALVVGDVSGKGVPAALFMVITKTLIKNQALMGNSPKEVAESVNDQLCENNEADMFVTLWLGILEISTGRMRAVSAGHEYPAIRRAEGGYEYLYDEHGLVLGVMTGVEHEEYEVQLQKGDSFFVYTDGAPDATNKAGEQFERERLLGALNKKKDAHPEELLKNVRSDIDAFVADAEQFDDITLLGMTYLGPDSGPEEERA